MATVRRTLTHTTADVIDENGDCLGSIERQGKVSPARLATIARRDVDNPLATIRNIQQTETTYSMREADFFAQATIVGDEPQD